MWEKFGDAEDAFWNAWNRCNLSSETMLIEFTEFHLNYIFRPIINGHEMFCSVKNSSPGPESLCTRVRCGWKMFARQLVKINYFIWFSFICFSVIEISCRSRRFISVRDFVPSLLLRSAIWSSSEHQTGKRLAISSWTSIVGELLNGYSFLHAHTRAGLRER